MSTPTPNSAEQFLSFLLNAYTLTDEQKDLYIGELLEGRLHPDLERDFPGLCAREAAAAEKDAAELAEELEAQEALLKAAQDDLNRQAPVLQARQEKELQEAVDGYNQYCAGVERNLDKSFETDARSEEGTEADAIRQMLKGQSGQKAA